MSTETKVIALTSSGSAILVSDADPEEAALRANAYQVLAHATQMLNSEGLTAKELRFAAEQLAASLRDVLDDSDD